MKKCQHLFLLFLKNFLFFFDFFYFLNSFIFFNFSLFSLNAEFFFSNYERTLSADFQFAQMDLARATLVLIRVLRTLINSIAKNLLKLQICLRFYSFCKKKLDIQAILFDFFYFPINTPALTKPRRPRGPDAEVIGRARALRSGTEKRPGMGIQLGKRKEADAAEGQEERSNEAAAGTPESTTAGSLWNPAVPPE